MKSKIENVNKSNRGKVFSYLRWSTERQTWGDSERRQNQLAEQWCARNGLALAGKETDSVSAFTGRNRREGGGLNRLLKKVGPGDVILIEDSDRWSREKPLDSLNALRETVNRGVDIVFLRSGVRVSKQNFDNPEVLIPSFFSSYLANAESAKKSVRLKASWQARLEAVKTEGKPINQNLPSWLRWNRETKQVVPIPERVKTVQRIFREYASGNSLRLICRKLVTEGVPSISKRKPGKWTFEYIHTILKNRSAIGECLGTPNVFPIIVAEAEFHCAEKRMKAAKHFTTGVHKAHFNLFTGVAICGSCGGPMNYSSFRRPEVVRAYLYCGPTIHGKTDCRLKGKRYGKGIKYKVFEESFLEIMGRFEELQKAMGGEQKPSRIDELQGKLSGVEARAEKFLRAFEDDPNPSARAMQRLKEIEAEESKLREELESEKVKARAERPACESWEEFAATLSTLSQDPSYRMKLKEAIRLIVDKIEIELGRNRYRIFVRDYYRPIQVEITGDNDFSYLVELPPE